MHRKLNNMAKMTGLFPLAVLSDCVVYTQSSVPRPRVSLIVSRGDE